MATAELTPTRAEREAHRKAVFRRKQTAALSEIGKPRLNVCQIVAGHRLRKLCENDLEAFNREAFPNSSGLKPFGQVQLDSIAHDREVVENGGRIVKAEPRGYTKTTRGCNAALWATLYGKRRMVPVFSANMEKSKTQIMARWKTELMSNDLLYWMFPKLIWPFRCLQNKSQRCASQTCNGRLTQTQWTSDRIVFPDTPGESGSGAVLVALPLKSCRGATHTMPDGTILRPDLLIFDDVQKDEDADNPNTIHKMEDLIDHTALMLGGHSQTISAIMNVTVRQPEDLNELYLKKHGWRRVRYKMLTKRALWEKELWLGAYADILKNYNPESVDDQRRAQKEALAFYLAHRDEMDEGAEVTWEWGYAWNDKDPVEASAIQHAYNILIDLGESVFASECQNEPLRDTGGLTILKPEQMRKKQSSYERNQVPKDCTKLTAFVDVHDNIHYWHVWTWEPRFTGYLIDYGTFPNQKRRNFAHTMLPVPLSKIFPGLDNPARVLAGLDAVIHGFDDEKYGCVGLLRREWLRTDNVPLKIALCGIDANGEESKVVKDFIRGSMFKELMYPSFGRGIPATTPPMSTWRKQGKRDEGPEWITQEGKPGEPIGVLFDTNYWKTQFHRALALAPGSQGASYVYKVENEEQHRRLSEHWYAERPKEVSCGSRVVYEFPSKFKGDNHDFDCAVGARVAASKAGIRSAGSNKPKKKRLTLQEMAARARR
jgi:hypothetical protein